MSYIGQQLPADVFSGFVTDSFTGDGSATTFTLSKAPFSEDALIVVINNVIQKPVTNFTVSGTTLTIVGTAVASGDVIYAMHTSGAVPSTLASKVDVNGLSDGIILDADADTTISADTDDQIDFKAGGTDTMHIINGKVGIGTTSPSTNLHIFSTSDNAPHLLLENFQNADTDDAAVIELYLNDETTGGIGDNTDVGVIRFTGDEKDGGTKETYAEIRGVAHDPGSGSSNRGNLSFFVQKAGSLAETVTLDDSETVFNDGGQDHDFRVEGDSNDKILMADAGDNGVYFGTSGNTTPAQSSSATHAFISAIGRMQISASSAACITTNRVSSEGITIELRQAGGVRGSISVAGASAAFNTSSDYRLKENVNYTWDGTTILKQLKPAKFNWKVDPDNTIHGFIAHEAKAVVPDSVIGEKDAVDDNGDVAPQQIDQSKLVPILVKTIQELEARIKTLEDA